jgi:glycosyltransferase involved in cell wall biosynthesis
MRILFLGEASIVYTRVWPEFFAATFGHEVHLGSLEDPGASMRGVTFHPIGPHKSRFGFLAAIPATRALWRALKPDLTVAYRVTNYGVLAAVCGLHPLTMAAQGQYIAFPPTSAVKRALARYALSRADLIMSWGSHMTRNMAKLGCDLSKVRTIAYGIDTNLFRPDPDRKRPNTPPRLLTTRKMRSDYYPEVIVRALPEVVKRFPDVRLTALGEGPERDRIRRLSEKLGVAGNLDLPGRVSLQRLIELLQGCDVYVSSVPTDGVSASLLEAMACGAWPVVTDNEANRLWIRPGVTGDLVSAHDAAASAIVNALENPARAAAAREINRTLVIERGSLTTNMAVIDRMLRALVEGGTSSVPQVPQNLVVSPLPGDDVEAAR